MQTKQTDGLLPTSKKQPPKHKGQNHGALSDNDRGDLKAILQERKEHELANRAEITTKIISKQLLLRDDHALCMGRIFATYRSQTLVIEDSIGHLVAGILDIPENENHRIRKIMGDLAYDVTNGISDGMLKFIKAH